MKKRLLAVQGPLQYLAGFIALSHSMPPGERWEDSENVLLLYDFLTSPDIEDDIADAVRQMTIHRPWSRVVHLRQSETDAFSRRHHAKNVRHLHHVLGTDHFDEIYLARDFMGMGSPTLMDAYGRAVKRAYGDSLGLVGQQAIRRVLDASSRPRWIDWSIALTKRLLWGRPAKFDFNEAVLTLPMDLSGEYFKRSPLVVPPHQHVMACVEEIASGLSGLDEYCESLCAQGTALGDRLYLLSNMAASNISTAEQEIDFYLEVIESSSPAQSTVYLKPHPRSTYESLMAIANRLQDRYKVIVIDDERHARIPIELWLRLIRHCIVVPMFSTSAINLKYLYGKPVDMPLTEQRMQRYVKPALLEFMRDSDRLIRESIENLDHWDQRTPLWSAHTVRTPS